MIHNYQQSEITKSPLIPLYKRGEYKIDSELKKIIVIN